MNKKNQLKLYKKALFWYTLSLWFPMFKYLFDTEWGFCLYFWGYSLDDLTELSKTRPIDFRPTLENRGYWFPKGEIKPRIKCLKQAIKNSKQ